MLLEIEEITQINNRLGKDLENSIRKTNERGYLERIFADKQDEQLQLPNLKNRIAEGGLAGAMAQIEWKKPRNQIPLGGSMRAGDLGGSGRKPTSKF